MLLLLLLLTLLMLMRQLHHPSRRIDKHNMVRFVVFRERVHVREWVAATREVPVLSGRGKKAVCQRFSVQEPCSRVEINQSIRTKSISKQNREFRKEYRESMKWS